MTKNEIREAVEEITGVVNTLVSALEANPELGQSLSELALKYFDVFKPLITESASLAIEVRASAFEEFKAMGLSDELAVKLVCGR